MDWDQYFISEAYLAARKSKDNSTQVGAVIVGPDREIRAKGYNGPPRGFNDDDPSIYVRPLKYALFAHAEENAITSCARIGVSCRGCAMYVTFHPCAHCARMIVQAGISEVIMHSEFPTHLISHWEDSLLIATRIFSECGVQTRYWSGMPLIREILVNGMWYPLPDEINCSVYEPRD